MTVTHGADADRLDAIAEILQAQGHRLATLTTQGGAMMSLLDGMWTGADAAHLSQQWRAGAGLLDRATATLEQSVRALRHQAHEQESTSAGSGQGRGETLGLGRGMSAVRSVPEGFTVPPWAAGCGPTLQYPGCRGALTRQELDRIEKEQQIDIDAPVVHDSPEGKINAAEAALMAAWLLRPGGLKQVESMLAIKREADAAGHQAYPNQGLDQQEDAFRHAYWNARMAQEHGAGDARALSNAHEMHADPTPLDDKREAMDLHNNEVGRRIAAEHPGASPEELKAHIRKAIECGEMIVIDEDGNTQPSNYNL